MKLNTQIVTACISVASYGTAFAAEIRVGVDASFPPFSAVAGDGFVVGLEVDFIDELSKRIEADCTIVPMQFDALISGLRFPWAFQLKSTEYSKSTSARALSAPSSVNG